MTKDITKHINQNNTYETATRDVEVANQQHSGRSTPKGIAIAVIDQREEDTKLGNNVADEKIIADTIRDAFMGEVSAGDIENQINVRGNNGVNSNEKETERSKRLNASIKRIIKEHDVPKEAEEKVTELLNRYLKLLEESAGDGDRD